MAISRKTLFDKTLEGYCLVFKKTTSFCELEVDGNILRVKRSSLKNDEHWKDDNYIRHMDDLLKSLREDKEGRKKKYEINYRIVEESDRDSENIYVVVSAQESLIEKWADERDVDVPIDAIKAIKCAKLHLKKFLLAKRTLLPTAEDIKEHDISEDSSDDASDSDIEYTIDVPLHVKKEELVPWNKWEDIHVGYEPILHNEEINIYRKPMNIRKLHPFPSAISHSLYLRILYEILTDDEELGGANFVIEKMFTNKYHPLCQFYALHLTEERAREKMFRSIGSYRCVACKWDSKGSNTKFLDAIRNYYGEQIAFYFAFLVHYTLWLYPIAILGGIWWIIEMILWGVTSPGSMIVVFVIILWSTLMIENWYRREWRLRFRWGMMRYKQTEIPRPTFSGTYVISSVNGLRIEAHSNKYLYWFKRIISIAISFICILLVVAVTVIIWNFQNQSRTADDEVNFLPVAIGMINSAQILLFNKIYTSLAVFLNDWEGHRLQQEYYNQLVIKRISFIVINSFYSLFYIAFIDDRKDYDENSVRLAALRMQLIILFLMAIIYQNSAEVFFPVCLPRIIKRCKKHCNCCCGNNKTKTKNKKNDEYTELNLNAKDDDDSSSSDVKLQAENIDDILKQSQLSKSPDVLDNTAEIIVLHGYVTLFIVVFPIMPLLGVINNFVELKVDKYNLVKTQRPVPVSAGGLGVWTTVLSIFAIVSIYSNLALVTFKTDIVIAFLQSMEDFFANIEQIYWTNEDMFENQVTFYFISTTFCVFVIIGIRMCIPAISNQTIDDIARQEICQREFLHISRQLEAKNQ